jgi:nucleotide-binding universal stress UspA family protein
MQRIFYSNDSLLTGSDIARALLEYAAALARSNGSETVNIPVRQPDGSTSRAMFLVGPASQLVAEDEESEFEELRDDIVVAKMKAMTAELAAPRAVSAQAASTSAEEVAGDLNGDSLEWL